MMNKNNNRKIKTIIIVLLILLSCCFLVYQLFYYKCLWNCAPKRTFTTEEFILPEDYFPKTAVISKIYGIRDDIELIYSAAADAYWNNGFAIYEIRRLPTERLAKNDYKRLISRYTNNIYLLSQFSIIREFSSSIANEYRVTCDKGLYNKTRCVYIARYEEFILFFNATIGPKDMTEENYLCVIKFIDKTFADILEK